MSRCQVAVLQGRALQLWTAGSQRGALAAWRTLTQHRRAVISRLSASAAANTRSSSFKVLRATGQLDVKMASCEDGIML